jgi:hypothetical protein
METLASRGRQPSEGIFPPEAYVPGSLRKGRGFNQFVALGWAKGVSS